MKKRIIFLGIISYILTIFPVLSAQNAPVDFETGGYGADWTWTVFENDTNPALEIIGNPDSSAPNVSATVAKFTALNSGQDWAGCETLDIGEFTFTAENSTVKIMVHKPITSDFRIKFEGPGPTVEINSANTVTGQWEELTYDFSASIGNTYNKLVIFPDFAPRDQDNIIYFDYLTFSEQIMPDEPETAAPTPTVPADQVISLFSNPYEDVVVDTWSAAWDAADVADVQIAGDDVKLYTNLVFAGIEFTSQTIDASEMTHFHMDIWTPDATALPAVFKIKLVDFGADGSWGGGDDVEHEVIFDENSDPPLETGSWVIFDIPLAEFTGLTTTGHLAQLIISADPNTVYIDNIYFYFESSIPEEPEVAAPIPVNDQEDVISIFSDSYQDLEGTNFNPFWGQTTIVTFEDIGDNSMMKYDVFNYQGTQLAAPQNLSLMEYIHIDMWTADATVVKFSPISVSTGEHLVYLTPITSGNWVSYDIPLSDFTGVSMTDIHQMKFDGQEGVTPSTIYLDNIYFWKNPTVPGTDATLSDLQVDGITVAGFDPNILTYNMELPYGTVVVPTVTATTNDPDATYVVIDAVDLPGTTDVVVTAENGVNTLTYSVNFTLEPAVPTVAAPDPTIPADDVISLFSNVYTDVTVDTWLAPWSQANLEEIQIAGNDTKLYTNLVFAGIEFVSQTIDATSMTNFCMDIWTPDPTGLPAVFKIKLVDFGADGAWGGGDDVEHELIFDENSTPSLTSETWISFDIPLSDFTSLITREHLAQLIISGDLNTVYLDNVYFYDDGSAVSFDPPENVAIDPQLARLTWTPPANTVIYEDFDDYTVGDYLCVVAPDIWQTWSNLPGGSEDVFISDAQANSPFNSILVELNQDIILLMDDYTSGVYSFDLDMYVPSGYCGYYNLQKTSTPGTEWAFQVYFQTDGTALVDAGAASAATFPFQHDEWMDCRVMVDLNNDWAEFYVNNQLKIGWQWTLGTFGTPGLLQFGGVNIFGGANSSTTDIPMFYVDNCELKEIIPARDELIGYNIYLDEVFEAYTTELFYLYEGLTAGESYTAGVSAVYDDPGESDVIEIEFTYEPVTDFAPPANLAAEIQAFNDVSLSWEAPVRTSSEIFNQNISNSRSLYGYKIYRGGVEIAEITGSDILTYLDAGMDSGSYQYQVTAIYTAPDGESDPSNQEDVNIVLPAPANVTASSNYPNIFVQWTAPSRTRAIESYNIYQDEALITNTSSTSYLHINVPEGTYIYNVAVVYTGNFEGDWSPDIEVQHYADGTDPIQIPLITELNGNFPNPFNPETKITFALTTPEHTKIEVYNLRGEKVRNLVDDYLETGFHEVIWNGENNSGKQVSSGVYFYIMKAGKYSATRKMILLR